MTAWLALEALAVDRDVAGLEPGLQPVARVLREQPRQRLVEAQPAERRAARARVIGATKAAPSRVVSRAIIFLPHAPQFTCLSSPRCLVVGCASDIDDETAGWSAQRLYGEAKDAMSSKDWPRAIKYLEKLEARYPYGRFAQQAQLEIAYAHWKDGERALGDRRGGPLHQDVSRTTPTSTMPGT